MGVVRMVSCGVMRVGMLRKVRDGLWLAEAIAGHVHTTALRLVSFGAKGRRRRTVRSRCMIYCDIDTTAPISVPNLEYRGVS